VSGRARTERRSSVPGGAVPRDGGARVELRLSQLATPPSPEELEALMFAVEAAIGVQAPRGGEPSAWRFSGRWWRPLPWLNRPR
jgi:hypothetical protein